MEEGRGMAGSIAGEGVRPPCGGRPRLGSIARPGRGGESRPEEGGESRRGAGSWWGAPPAVVRGGARRGSCSLFGGSCLCSSRGSREAPYLHPLTRRIQHPALKVCWRLKGKKYDIARRLQGAQVRHRQGTSSATAGSWTASSRGGASPKAPTPWKGKNGYTWSSSLAWRPSARPSRPRATRARCAALSGWSPGTPETS